MPDKNRGRWSRNSCRATDGQKSFCSEADNIFLGILKDERAVGPLMDVINRRDIFLKTLAIKEALQAVGIIGAKRPSSVDENCREKAFVCQAAMGRTKVGAIGAIGRIGDETSVDFLRKMGTVADLSERPATTHSIHQRERQSAALTPSALFRVSLSVHQSFSKGKGGRLSRSREW
jgi:hypothetical protein